MSLVCLISLLLSILFLLPLYPSLSKETLRDVAGYLALQENCISVLGA
jgi:hypothetical protein